MNPPDHTDAAAPPLRILVVEDNADAQFLVCEMMRAFGHSAEGSDSAEQALARLQAEPFDVLFSDVSLPGMSGIALARQARALYPKLGVIFASGYSEGLQTQVEFPCVALRKPYELSQLKAALATAAQAR